MQPSRSLGKPPSLSSSWSLWPCPSAPVKAMYTPVGHVGSVASPSGPRLALLAAEPDPGFEPVVPELEPTETPEPADAPPSLTNTNPFMPALACQAAPDKYS